MVEEEFIKIATMENEIEAQLLDSILNEQDIPHLIRSYHDAAYDGIFIPQKGWGSVYAPESQRETIREIISNIRRGI